MRWRLLVILLGLSWCFAPLGRGIDGSSQAGPAGDRILVLRFDDASGTELDELVEAVARETGLRVQVASEVAGLRLPYRGRRELAPWQSWAYLRSVLQARGLDIQPVHGSEPDRNHLLVVPARRVRSPGCCRSLIPPVVSSGSLDLFQDDAGVRVTTVLELQGLDSRAVPARVAKLAAGDEGLSIRAVPNSTFVIVTGEAPRVHRYREQLEREGLVDAD